jgi:hypothetical protein
MERILVQLPEECATLVVSYLSLKDCLSLRALCKWWKDTCHTRMLFLNIRLVQDFMSDRLLEHLRGGIFGAFKSLQNPRLHVSISGFTIYEHDLLSWFVDLPSTILDIDDAYLHLFDFIRLKERKPKMICF